MDVAECIAKLRPRRDLTGPFLDRIEPIADGRRSGERLPQPGPEQASAHRGGRAIERLGERARAGAGGPLEDLQPCKRDRVDDDVVGAVAERETPQMGELTLLGVAQIVHESAGGANRSPVLLDPQPEPLERRRAELIEKGTVRPVEPVGPFVDRRDRHARRGRCQSLLETARGRHQQLAGSGCRDLVRERVHAACAVVLRDAKLSRRQLRHRDPVGELRAPARRVSRDRQQKCRLASLEVSRIRQGAGRHDTDHLPAHQPARLPGRLHLLADRNPETLADEAHDVCVGSVMRDTAHRNGIAVRVAAAGRERQIQGAGAGHRVLVEHLVEIAHPKENQSLGILALGIEVLPHRRRGSRLAGRSDPGRRSHRVRW